MWSSSCGIHFLLLLFLVDQLQATENVSCQNAITDRHLQFLDELIDSQLHSSCKITFEFVDPAQLTDEVCYIQVAFEFLNDIFNTHMKFKHGSLNFNNTEEVKELFHELLFADCIPTLDKGCCKQCGTEFTRSTQEMLEMVKDVFQKSQRLLRNSIVQMRKSCLLQFAQCRRLQQPTPTGPAQCDCSCPTLQNLTRGDSTFLLTTSINWEHLPNTSTAAPTIMPDCQGSKGIRESSLSDMLHTPVASSETEFRDYSSGQGAGESVNPSFIPSPVMLQSVSQGQKARAFSTEPPSVEFTSTIKNSMNDGESSGATAMAQTVGVESKQPHSLQAVFGIASHASNLLRTSSKGLGEDNAAHKGPTVALSRTIPTLAPGTPFPASRKDEDPVKDFSAPWKVPPLTGLEELITKARLPSKRRSSEFRSKGGGESAQMFSEREEHLAGPRTEFHPSVTDTGKETKQEKLHEKAQSRAFLSCILLLGAGLLLTLCGLLYYWHKSKTLKQSLEQTLRDAELEERPLNGDLVELCEAQRISEDNHLSREPQFVV